jgi:hypothetical protein
MMLIVRGGCVGSSIGAVFLVSLSEAVRFLAHCRGIISGETPTRRILFRPCDIARIPGTIHPATGKRAPEKPPARDGITRRAESWVSGLSSGERLEHRSGRAVIREDDGTRHAAMP